MEMRPRRDLEQSICDTQGCEWLVVGVDIQFIETYNVGIGVGEFKKFRMIAYGTAMIIEP